jgi:hypothetical protein
VKFNYVLSGTFYGIKKACHGRSVLSRSWHVPQNPTRFWTSNFFNGKIRQTLFIWLQISFGAPFLALILVLDFGPFLRAPSRKKLIFAHICQFLNLSPPPKKKPFSQITLGKLRKCKNLAKNGFSKVAWSQK